MKRGALLRIGGCAGLMFLVLNLVGQVSAFGADAKVNDPIPTLTAYYANHRHQMFTSVIILAAGAFFLMWFLGALYQLLRTPQDDGNPLPAVVLVAGAAATSMFLLERMPQAILAVMAGQPGGLSDGLAVRALSDMQGVLTSAFIMTLAVLTPAIAAALVRRGLAGAWLAWLGGISAALFLASGLAGYTTIDNDTWDNVLHLADLGAYIVVVVAAIVLIRAPGSGVARVATASASAPVTAA